MHGDPMPQGEEHCGNRFARLALVFIVGYFLFEAIFISFISNGAGLDDAEQLANISFFDWGYGGSQPPLYTWILIGVTSVFGTHFIVLQLVKFTILASLFLSVYFGLRNLKVPALVAASAMLGIFLLPQIAWESQRALSHSVLGTASCGWVFWAMTVYLQRQTLIKAGLLGVVIAVSVLGKFNDVIFLVAIFAAALSLEQSRKGILNRKTFFVFIVAAVLLFKPLAWILSNMGATLERSGKFGLSQNYSFLVGRIYGITDFIGAVLSFVGILLIVTLAIYFLNRSKRQSVQQNSDTKFALRFIGRALGIALAIVFLVVVISGATQVKDRWLQPVLILAPAYFALIIYNYIGEIRAVIAYGLCCFIVALIVPVGLYINLNGKKNDGFPLGLLRFDELYAVVKEEGPIATIVSPNTKYAGNLRLFDQNWKVVHDETVNPFSRIQRPILILLHEGSGRYLNAEEEGQAFKEPLASIIARLMEAGEYQGKSIKIPYKGYPESFEILRYIYIP